MRITIPTRANARILGIGILAGIFAVGSASAVTLQTLYPASTPLSSLVAAPDGNLYGTSRYGGTYDLGTVFKISTTGAYQEIFSFTGGGIGSHPNAGLTLGPDGQLYGTTRYGGIQNAGLVFKITTSGSFTSLHLLVHSTEGAEPVGGLVVGTNGMLYGTASCGGALGFGSVFQITTNGSLTVLRSFTGSDGNGPVTTLAVGADGLLYGTTQYGGTDDGGTVFKVSTGGTFTSLFSFHNTDGAYPTSALVQGADNALYGTTEYGGANGFGSIFRITPGGTFNSLHSMFAEDSGSNPIGGLVLGPDDDLYGSTVHGGTNGFGCIFRATTSSGYSAVYHFSGFDDGGGPLTSFARGKDGNYYGTTSFAGQGGGGTFYRLALAPFVEQFKLSPDKSLVQMSGIGGTPNSQYLILTTTNAAALRVNWDPLALRFFDESGRFNFTNSVNKQEQRRFYLLRQL